MLPGLTFLTWRIFEILTLIPTVGMLSWFVKKLTDYNTLTPTSILVLFIVSVLALFWALATLAFYSGTKYNGQFCAVVDLLLVGAFIAGVYYLRAIGHSNCSQWGPGNTDSGQIDLGFATYSGSVYYPFRFELNKACAMLKASWAFGIMNIIFFFVTFVSKPIVFPEQYQMGEIADIHGISLFFFGLLAIIMTTIALALLTAPIPLVATILAARDVLTTALVDIVVPMSKIISIRSKPGCFVTIVLGNIDKVTE
jgi:hypothetical protein